MLVIQTAKWWLIGCFYAYQRNSFQLTVLLYILLLDCDALAGIFILRKEGYFLGYEKLIKQKNKQKNSRFDKPVRTCIALTRAWEQWYASVH